MPNKRKMILNAQLEMLMIPKNRKKLYKRMKTNNMIIKAKTLTPNLIKKLEKIHNALLANVSRSK